MEGNETEALHSQIVALQYPECQDVQGNLFIWNRGRKKKRLPLNLVFRGWGGAQAIEIAHNLELMEMILFISVGCEIAQMAISTRCKFDFDLRRSGPGILGRSRKDLSRP